MFIKTQHVGIRFKVCNVHWNERCFKEYQKYFLSLFFFNNNRHIELKLRSIFFLFLELLLLLLLLHTVFWVLSNFVIIFNNWYLSSEYISYIKLESVAMFYSDRYIDSVAVYFFCWFVCLFGGLLNSLIL